MNIGDYVRLRFDAYAYAHGRIWIIPAGSLVKIFDFDGVTNAFVVESLDNSQIQALVYETNLSSLSALEILAECAK